MLSVIFAINYQLRHDEGLICKESKLSWPELSGFQSRGMNYNLVSFSVKGGCGLEILDIRAMS